MIGENLNALIALGGFVWLYVGIAGWSTAAANTVAGVLLLAVGVWPYVRAR